ncbi:uncharacterized protein B0J16DRAFT_374727 [Fusarium flagelliforme]|uniref:uncharacterized protein n=1 Tax=Fusarium flagelliforme TaxID=2675880 RepID=UPI001E8D2379|nr:uncharacterized protein B0J16DRAFT_374727 [Fusarium flagelliforme]KAH7179720.1 hypothetical protein B0J16DRAFT_374727 [Fusarium flagelliforme]
MVRFGGQGLAWAGSAWLLGAWDLGPSVGFLRDEVHLGTHEAPVLASAGAASDRGAKSCRLFAKQPSFGARVFPVAVELAKQRGKQRQTERKDPAKPHQLQGTLVCAPRVSQSQQTLIQALYVIGILPSGSLRCLYVGPRSFARNHFF